MTTASWASPCLESEAGGDDGLQLAMLAKTPYLIVRDAVIAHLTFAEGLGPLLSNVALRPMAKAS